MKIIFDKRFKKNLQGRFGKYDFQVGVLDDGPHKLAKRGERGQKGQDVLTTYAKKPARKKSTVNSGLSISEISKLNRERLGFNYLSKPFQGRGNNADIIKFVDAFFKLVFGRSEKKRAENLLQAVVRNPIQRGDYGNNSDLTQKIKGFDRYMVDTAQLFKAIKAACKVRG